MRLNVALRNMGALQKVALVSIASNLILSAGMFYTVAALNNTHERLVIIPPHLDKKAEIAWESANSSYIKSFGFYVANMIGNLQPETAGIILDAVSVFMEPRIYSDFRRQAFDIINDPIFKQTKSSTFFQPASIIFERSTSKVFVIGDLQTKTINSTLNKSVVYELGIVIREGRPWISHFTSYEGKEPRTTLWYLKKEIEVPEHAKPKTNNFREEESEIDQDGDLEEQVFDAEGMESINDFETEPLPADASQ